MPPDEILNQIIQLVQGMQSRGETIDPRLESALISILSQSLAAPPPASIPFGADLLWVLAGEQPEAFVSYLRTVPDPALNNLVNNPPLLGSVIEKLQRTVTLRQQVVSDGIPSASLSSSNIFGFTYDPRNKKLMVKFQGNEGYGDGPVYEYEGVPPMAYKIFAQGAVPAKTSGGNKWGLWFQGKQPSLGAAFYQMIRQAGFPYQRVA